MPSGDAVGELRLLGVEVLQGADGPGLGVVGHQVPLVEVGAGVSGQAVEPASVQAGVEVAVGLDMPDSSTLAHTTGP